LHSRLAELRLVSVPLTSTEIQTYYEDFCNGILWPAMHYLIERLPLVIPNFDVYERINERFADAVAAHYEPNDVVWVHDYQLMLLPAMLRARLGPGARIGFFLHIPFPASDVFRVFPFRERLLDGLLGADMVGFHTPEYTRHFASSVLRTFGVAMDVDRFAWQGRAVRVGVLPIGIDTAEWDKSMASASVSRLVSEIRDGGGSGAPMKIFLAVEHVRTRLSQYSSLPRAVQVFMVPRRVCVHGVPQWRSCTRQVHPKFRHRTEFRERRRGTRCRPHHPGWQGHLACTRRPRFHSQRAQAQCTFPLLPAAHQVRSRTLPSRSSVGTSSKSLTIEGEPNWMPAPSRAASASKSGN
jgi:hypothetical protein